MFQATYRIFPLKGKRPEVFAPKMNEVFSKFRGTLIETKVREQGGKTFMFCNFDYTNKTRADFVYDVRLDANLLANRWFLNCIFDEQLEIYSEAGAPFVKMVSQIFIAECMPNHLTLAKS